MPTTLPKPGTGTRPPTEVGFRPPGAPPPLKRTPIVRWMAWLVGFAILAVAAALLVNAFGEETVAPGESEIDPHDSPEILRTAVPAPAAAPALSPFSEVDVQRSPEALRPAPAAAVTPPDPHVNPEILITSLSGIGTYQSPEALRAVPARAVTPPDPHESPEVLHIEP